MDMNEISPLVSQVIPSRCAWRTLFGKCVSIVVYAHCFLSDKTCILLRCVHMFLCAFFQFYAHLGVSIQDLFYAILQNAHRNRWMEMQLVTALKYETQMVHEFIRCLYVLFGFMHMLYFL